MLLRWHCWKVQGSARGQVRAWPSEAQPAKGPAKDPDRKGGRQHPGVGAHAGPGEAKRSRPSVEKARGRVQRTRQKSGYVTQGEMYLSYAVGRIKALEEAHAPIPGTCVCVTFHGSRDFVDVMKTTVLRRGDDLGSPRWACCHQAL